MKSQRLRPRLTPPYDFQKDVLADRAEYASTEARTGVARNSRFADDEDADPLPSLGSRYGDAGIEDNDARVLAQEDDPDYRPTRVEDSGFEAWSRTIWSEATTGDKKKARGLKHGEQFAGATCHLLVLARAGLCVAASRKRAALLVHLDEWAEEHRPELSGHEFHLMLSECRSAALEQLSELDAKYGLGGGCDGPDGGCHEKPLAVPGAGPDTSKWVDTPAQLYRDEYKGRTMVVFGWVASQPKKKPTKGKKPVS